MPDANPLVLFLAPIGLVLICALALWFDRQFTGGWLDGEDEDER
jgi:hypothetical protein